MHRAKIKSGLTIRGGMARAAAWNYLFKSFTAKDWGIFCEAYGQPVRIGKWGDGATEADKDKLLQAVADISSDYAAIIPQSMAIEFVNGNLSGNHELYQKRADWLDQQISKLVLGQTATTDAIAGGHAVGKIHDQVRGDIEVADARQLATTLRRDLIRPVVDLNIGPRPVYPQIRIGRPDDEDVNSLVNNVVALVPLGLKVGMSTMRDKLGLPDPDKDEDLLSSPAAGTPIVPAPDNVSAQSAQRHQHAPDAIDQSVSRILADNGWQPMIEPVIAGLEEELAGATTLDEARRILQRRADTVSASQLAELLARTTFRARISGEAGEDID